MIARLLVSGALAFGACVVIGWRVTHGPLNPLDALGLTALGKAEPLAIALTACGYAGVLAVLAVATVAGALALRLPAQIPIAIVVAQLTSQGAVDLLKGLFARSRPPAWLFRHEPGFAYPSGHATTAVVFYGSWALVVWNCALPIGVRIGGSALLVFAAAGIGWSRTALGAHYVTDVAGGFLFGAGWLSIGLAGTAIWQAVTSGRPA